MASITFPPSDLYAIQETSFAGRGVFATKSISAGTPLMTTDLIPAHVVYREYKREVCAHCFGYEQSRAHKLKISETGHAFCSKECLRAWKTEAGGVGLEAWTTLETFVKGKGGRAGNGKELDGNVYDTLPDEGAVRPTPQEIHVAWEDAEQTAELIRKARAGSKQKIHRKALQSTLALQMYPDTLTLLLSGVLTVGRDAQNEKSKDWGAVLELVEDHTPYTSLQDLAKNVRSYLHLVCVLPMSLLEHISGQMCLTLVSRDSHNSFGIRSLDDNGSEMFGFAIWPLASYWNHSCEPSVRKRRVGRAWEFETAHDIVAGEELCISYMGGDEQDLSLSERRGRSEDIWGFTCACAKCVREEEELEGTTVGSEGS
jgi:SET and MYND domain-containing protein